ncbi:MAG: cyclodeaminase/cyclohydrolase family protein [Ignavibacteriaceae bacterium]|nr:cyclodeaminase/cyclohydrolase family protein [Ignavibacteriaceae bacterium]
MNTDMTLQNYIESLSSDSPTPGGGNVAAFCGTLASSLGVMVCNLTIGKKKYADVQEKISLLKESLLEKQKMFISLATADNAAFDKVMAAMKLPKETDEQKAIRAKAIEQATMEAIEVPDTVISECTATAPLLIEVAKTGNKNSVSDAGVGLTLLRAGAEGAYLNVIINCASLSDRAIAEEILKRADAKLNSVRLTADDSFKMICNLIFHN